MKYETRVIAMTILPVGEKLYSELATTVSIADESGGEFVEVNQSGRDTGGTIAIMPVDWPHIRDAIERMIAECEAHAE